VKVAVFVDGCFWHGCPKHGGIPKNNRQWWAQKLEKNRERDDKKDNDLLALGWLPIHVWEHESVSEAADRLQELWIGSHEPVGKYVRPPA
jgi:DNA mismatch endonuclease (patch repair protein)